MKTIDSDKWIKLYAQIGNKVQGHMVHWNKWDNWFYPAELGL